VYYTSTTDWSNSIAFTLSKNDLNGVFSPDTGTKYVVGAWVKVGADVKRSTYYNASTGCYVKVGITKSNNAVVNTNLYPAGPIIEGWQRIEGTVTLAYGDKTMKVELISANESGTSTFFDDIRVHPYDAKMKSYVYDPKTLRLVAELDENNYATFYEYDAEGQLVRVKRETEKGIVTVKESRSHQYKKAN
jgi:YD repeat-containing protein